MMTVSCALIFITMLIWLFRSFVGHAVPLQYLTQIGNLFMSKEALRELGTRLDAVDIKISPELLCALRISVAIILSVIGLLTIWKSPFVGVLILALALAGFKLPMWYLDRLEKSRKEEISREFPIMVDLVRIYAQASDLYQALKITPHALKGELAKQMHILSAELEVSPFTEALENFAYRCRLRQVQDFIGIVLRGIKSGMDVDQILQRYSSMAYEERVTEIKRKIKIQPLIFSVLPGILMFSLILLWLFPMYANIISRLQAF